MFFIFLSEDPKAAPADDSASDTSFLFVEEISDIQDEFSDIQEPRVSWWLSRLDGLGLLPTSGGSGSMVSFAYCPSTPWQNPKARCNSLMCP